jgi:DEAD/DEAH box helicase domain-containing protein
MAFLRCECGEMLKGVQVSRHVLAKGEYRYIEYKVGGMMDLGVWKPIGKEEWLLNVEDGVYCEKCHRAIETEQEEENTFADTRIPSINASEFKASEMANRLEKLAEKERAELFIHTFPSSEAVYSTTDYEVPESLSSALKRMKIESLYSHQAATYNHVRSRKNVVLVTHTASGKTLSYNLPVLQGLIENKYARALYLFPTKALADDQIEQLYRWTEEDDVQEEVEDEWYERNVKIGGTVIPYGRLDGDTPPGSRKRLIEKGRIIFSNPDMLHFSLLKRASTNQAMRRYFSELKYVVIDEMHLYRGAFGTHVSMVLRRLRSLCAELGNDDIQFILCSATINKPELLAESLTGVTNFEVVDNDGSKKQERSIVFWNPGMTLDKGDRKAPLTDALAIAEEVLVKDDRVVRSIMFQGSRLQGKVSERYMKDVLRKKLKLKKDKVTGMKLTAFYNGMLPADERKQVIKALKENDVHMVITTNALEVGIDLGDLSCALIIGYPGSKAAFSQQIGRVGRKGEGSAVLIFEDEPLQQFYMNNPKMFLDKEPEIVRIDPRNKELLALHLTYMQEEIGRKLTIEDIITFTGGLENAEELLPEETAEPIERCNLRTASGPQYKVVTNRGREVLLDSIDEWTALRDFHEGAIYWNANGRVFRIDSIHKKTNEIIVVPMKGEAEYYTQSLYHDVITILDNVGNEEVGVAASLMAGNLNVKRSVFAYRKNFFGSKVHKDEPIEFPHSASFQTEGVWLILQKDLINDVKNVLDDEEVDRFLDGAIRAAEHAILSVIPDTVICDARDISGFSSFSMPGFSNQPVIGFYGGNSGGMGTTIAIKENLGRIVVGASKLVSTCTCKGGCPSCIQYPGKDNDSLSKKGAEVLLNQLSNAFTIYV